MELHVYQQEALKTAIYPLERALDYTVLGLCSEAGELAGKVKKIIRDEGGVLTTESKAALKSELGDVLWYAAAVADALETNLNVVAFDNLKKLRDRAKRNVLQGSGDNR